jgi:hypothetical protein
MTAEAATPKQNRKKQDNKVSSSPLELYKHKFCDICPDSEWCRPNELRMLICVLCATLDTQPHTKQLNQQRGPTNDHYC